MGFASTLKVEVLLSERNGFLLFEGEGEFRLLEPFVYGDVVVPAGYVTDFCSIPAPARAFFPISGKAAPAGVLHDFLLRNDATKRRATATFNAALRDGGVAAWRRWAMVAFVFIFTAPDVFL